MKTQKLLFLTLLIMMFTGSMSAANIQKKARNWIEGHLPGGNQNITLFEDRNFTIPGQSINVSKAHTSRIDIFINGTKKEEKMGEIMHSI